MYSVGTVEQLDGGWDHSLLPLSSSEVPADPPEQTPSSATGSHWRAYPRLHCQHACHLVEPVVGGRGQWEGAVGGVS